MSAYRETRVCSVPVMFVGAAVSAGLFASMWLPTGRLASHAKSQMAALDAREAVYLLPLLPVPHHKPVPYRGSPNSTTSLSGAGTPSAEARVAMGGVVIPPLVLPPIAESASGSHEGGTGPGRFGTSPDATDGVGPHESPSARALMGGNTYADEAQEHQVARDPASAAPVYPADLMRRGIEGIVVAQYTVDSTGVADSASIVIETTTQSAFADAVRAAVPHMHFQPAEVAGHAISQNVRQTFKFVLPHAADTAHNINRNAAPAMDTHTGSRVASAGTGAVIGGLATGMLAVMAGNELRRNAARAGFFGLGLGIIVGSGWGATHPGQVPSQAINVLPPPITAPPTPAAQ